MTLTMALSLALGIPETPENSERRNELIGLLQAMCNKEEDSDD